LFLTFPIRILLKEKWEHPSKRQTPPVLVDDEVYSWRICNSIVSRSAINQKVCFYGSSSLQLLAQQWRYIYSSLASLFCVCEIFTSDTREGDGRLYRLKAKITKRKTEMIFCAARWKFHSKCSKKSPKIQIKT
jgi:hypothetical protein